MKSHFDMSDLKSQPTPVEAALNVADTARTRDEKLWLAACGEMEQHRKKHETSVEASYRILAAEYRRAHVALLTIEERYIDGCVTLDDYLFMGNTARGYFDATPNQ